MRTLLFLTSLLTVLAVPTATSAQPARRAVRAGDIRLAPIVTTELGPPVIVVGQIVKPSVYIVQARAPIDFRAELRGPFDFSRKIPRGAWARPF